MIRLKNASKLSSDKKSYILKDVNLSVSQGDYICVSGSSSTARSSLIRMMAGLTSRDEGEVIIDGVEYQGYTFSQLASLRRDKFALLLLDMELDNGLNVEENVMLPLIYAGRDNEKKAELVWHALSILGMQKFNKARVGSLNDWQKNKVLLARAIVTSPRVLIIEEPCRNLDPSKIIEVEGLLDALNKEGITIIVSSNQALYLEKARTIYTIVNGEVVETRREEAKKFAPIAKVPRKPRKKKEIAKEESDADEGEKVVDSEINTKGESAKLYESEQQMSFVDFQEHEALKVVSKPKKTRKKTAVGEEKNEG